MSYVYYDFTQADGVASGWTQGGTNNLQVVSNKCSTTANSDFAGFRAHGLTLGDFDIHATVTHSRNVDQGGINVFLMDPSGNGWGFFAGNALHIQKWTAQVNVNQSNDGLPGEGTGGVGTDDIRLTRVGSTITSYINGGQASQITDAAYSTGLTNLVAMLYTTIGTANTIDDLMVSDVVGAEWPPSGAGAALALRRGLNVPGFAGARTRGRW